jgi:hypothetical protein
MGSSTISSDELFAHVEATRRKEELEREPYLRRFRALPEELAQQAIEAEALASIKLQYASMESNHARIHIWAEQLAQCAREGLRFERWFDKNVPGC